MHIGADGEVMAPSAPFLTYFSAEPTGMETMILYLQSVLLGIVQGITEFLPISSTGHMILVDEFIRLEASFKEMFFVVIQLGSILAVLVYFHGKLFPLRALRDARLRKSTLLLWSKAAVGVLPAIVIGGLFGSRIQHFLYNTLTVAAALLAGGIALLWIESVRRKVTVSEIDDLSFGKALAIGGIQCLAMIPGTSRSVATILGSLLLGTSREVAVEYSFFLAVPTMFAASAYSLWKGGSVLTTEQWIATGIGFLVSFLVAWGVIAFFMDYIRRKNFKVFGWYRIVLGIVLLVWFGRDFFVK